MLFINKIFNNRFNNKSSKFRYINLFINKNLIKYSLNKDSFTENIYEFKIKFIKYYNQDKYDYKSLIKNLEYSIKYDKTFRDDEYLAKH